MITMILFLFEINVLLYITLLYSKFHVCVHVCRRFLPLVFNVLCRFDVTSDSSRPRPLAAQPLVADFNQYSQPRCASGLTNDILTLRSSELRHNTLDVYIN